MCVVIQDDDDQESQLDKVKEHPLLGQFVKLFACVCMRMNKRRYVKFWSALVHGPASFLEKRHYDSLGEDERRSSDLGCCIWSRALSHVASGSFPSVLGFVVSGCLIYRSRGTEDFQENRCWRMDSCS